jgi:hypothetical protein
MSAICGRKRLILRILLVAFVHVITQIVFELHVHAVVLRKRKKAKDELNVAHVSVKAVFFELSLPSGNAPQAAKFGKLRKFPDQFVKAALENSVPDLHRLCNDAARVQPIKNVILHLRRGLFENDDRRHEAPRNRGREFFLLQLRVVLTVQVLPNFQPCKLKDIAQKILDGCEALPKVWSHCFRALVPGGRLICVVGDVCLSRRKNNGRHTVVPLHASIQEHCRKIGFDNLAL